jgi:hypothetical protein
MKLLAALAPFLLLAACESAKSKLDDMPKGAKAEKPAVQVEELPPGASLEDRVARLEKIYEKYGEPLDFLDKVYAQQKQQMAAQQEQMKQRELNELAPDGVWAVDISNDLKAGQVEGPNNALVTIVEAWDFG